jgi:hypothetical protein
VSKRKKIDQLEPQLIDENWGDEPHSFAFIPQQIEADWHEKWGVLLEGFPLLARMSSRMRSEWARAG